MSLSETMNQVKSSEMFGLKKVYRISKQATLQRVGKSDRVPEDPDFRSAVDQTNAVKASFKQMCTNITSLLTCEETMRTAIKTLSDAYAAMGRTREDSPLAGLLALLKEMSEQMDPFRETAYSKSRAECLDPLLAFQTGTVAELESLKKQYNKVRLQHDSIKHSLDKATVKAATKPEKLVRLQNEYAPIATQYETLQRDYMARAAYLEASVQRNVGLDLAKMYRELQVYHGQMYRIMTEYMPRIDEFQRKLFALPEPQAPATTTIVPPTPTSATATVSQDQFSTPMQPTPSAVAASPAVSMPPPQ